LRKITTKISNESKKHWIVEPVNRSINVKRYSVLNSPLNDPYRKGNPFKGIQAIVNSVKNKNFIRATTSLEPHISKPRKKMTNVLKYSSIQSKRQRKACDILNRTDIMKQL
jgi:hypothetical protein